VSVVIFMLERNTQTMHAQLSQFANPLNGALHGPVVGHIWNLSSLAGRAALNGEITRQAAIVAYMDDYRLMAWLRSRPRRCAVAAKARARKRDDEPIMAME